jgi:hypothetical protein
MKAKPGCETFDKKEKKRKRKTRGVLNFVVCTVS